MGTKDKQVVYIVMMDVEYLPDASLVGVYATKELAKRAKSSANHPSYCHVIEREIDNGD